MFRGWTGDLSCRLVAEGIETAEELAALRDLNCDYGRGFWLGRPSPHRNAAVALGAPAQPKLEARASDWVRPMLACYGSAMAQGRVESSLLSARTRSGHRPVLSVSVTPLVDSAGGLANGPSRHADRAGEGSSSSHRHLA